MGEEELKPEETKAEEKKPEEPKKAEEAEPAEKPAQEEKPAKEPKAEGDAAPPPPPPPPQEILLKVFMHCEGCARKVRRCLKGFPGVEEVITDCKSHKVVIKGEKADPLKVVERVQKKSHRKVELVSPLPKPPSEEETKPPAEEENPKPPSEEKKEEPQIVTVVLKVHMHCEACAQEIKRRILRMKGVESAEADLKNSVVSVKGAYEPANLVDYVYKRTGKHAVIVKQEADQKKEEEEAPKQEEEKKTEEGGEKKDEEKEKEAATSEAKAEEEEEKEKEKGEEGEKEEEEEEEEGGEVVRKTTTTTNEYYYYPQRYGMEVYAYPPPVPAGGYYPTQPVYPPQIFSDENPNACTVM